MILANSIPVRYLFTTARSAMLFVSLFTAVSIVIHMFVEFPEIPISLSAFLGTAISLILSFRLAQAYDRWWEARMIWGSIVNDSRSLILQLQSFSKKSEKVRVEKMAKRHIAWVSAVATMLRKQGLKEEMKSYLDPSEFTAAQEAGHAPLLLMKKQMQDLEALGLSTYEKIQIDNTIVRLIASMGQAERIKNTVFPTEYQYYHHLSIYLFLAFISISLANLGHDWEIALIIVIAAPFFLLEKAAEHLQDPFEDRPTDIPITAISRNIEINVLNLIEAEPVPEAIAAKDYYLN